MRQLFTTMFLSILVIVANAQNVVPKRNASGKYGFIDKSGKEVVPFKYDDAGYNFEDGIIKVKLNAKYGFIDETGKVVIPISFMMRFVVYPKA